MTITIDEPEDIETVAVLCDCSIATPCPLGKRGMAGRCTFEELSIAQTGENFGSDRYEALRERLESCEKVKMGRR